jgi:CDP-glycerol glycerophosphotransferase (TagB/SpsB family)
MMSSKKENPGAVQRGWGRRPLIKHPFKFFFRGILYRFIVGRLLILPLALLVPKKKNSLLFIGRDDGQFIDNIKYLFLYVWGQTTSGTTTGIDITFLTENRAVFEELKEKNYPVVFSPTFRSALKLLRTSVLVVDNINWIVNFKNMYLFRTRKIQLFHAVPIKRIGSFSPILEEERKYFAMRLYQWVNGQHQVYDWFLSPSRFFTERVFSKAYPSRYIFEGGLPRNDALFGGPDRQVFSGKDGEEYERINGKKGSGKKIVLYMPTFRDKGKGAFYENVLDVRELSVFAEIHGIHFLVKYHQLERAKFRDEVLGGITNITFFYDVKDIYPFLPLVDVLITDYSSIYFDYLLLDRPVVFFPYDLEIYLEKERGLIFDYDDLTPGPKCFTQEELLGRLKEILVDGRDYFKEKRAEVANIAFKYKDGKSSERIWKDIQERFFS